MRRFCSLLLALMLLSGCTPPEVSRQFFAMDTTMTITLTGPGADQAATAVIQEISRLDTLLSRTRPDSDLSRLNAAAGSGTAVPLSPDTIALLGEAVRLAQALPDGFDPTIAPVMDLWGFGQDTAGVPPQDALVAALPLVDASALVMEETGAHLTAPGMAADLGGIAKGYAADRVVAMLAQAGIPSGLLSLGSSSLAAIGTKPDGTPWRIGVKDPQSTETYLGVLSLTDAVLSTSGGYERYFEENGQIYHHIIDPRTGYPAQSDLLSVTVISPSGTEADALSTALFILGSEAALDLWRSRDDLGLVLVRTDGTVLVTQGLDFQPREEGLPYEIISR